MAPLPDRSASGRVSSIDARSSLHPDPHRDRRPRGLARARRDATVTIDVDGRARAVTSSSPSTSSRRATRSRIASCSGASTPVASRRSPAISSRCEPTATPARYLVGGDLTFRGVTRRYDDEMTVERSDDATVTLSGQSVFDIRDFGMEPPRILMLKVEPEVDGTGRRRRRDERRELTPCASASPARSSSCSTSNEHLARVDVQRRRPHRSTSACSRTRSSSAGDWVLIHVGFAMSKIDEDGGALRRWPRCR